MKEIYKNLVCSIFDNKIVIYDSYKVNNRSEMNEILYAIYHNHPNCNVFKRKGKCLIAEGRAHNRLYRLGYKKGSTQHTTLNYPMKGYYQILYNIIGI